MRRYYRDLLLIISIFFIAFSFAEELQCRSDKTVYVDVVHKERPIGRVTSDKRAHGSISQMSRARGVYGGGSLVRPKGKKNRAMSSMTKSASLAVLQVTLTILAPLFLY